MSGVDWAVAAAIGALVQLGNWLLGRKAEVRRDRVDPLAAAAVMTESMAGAVGVLVEPMRLEIMRLRSEIDLQRDEIKDLVRENQELKHVLGELRAELSAAKRGKL